MQNRIIGAGIFVAGALFGWAVAADKAENDQKKRDEEWAVLLNDKTDQIFALKNKLQLTETKVHYPPVRIADARPDLKLVMPTGEEVEVGTLEVPDDVDVHQLELNFEEEENAPHIVRAGEKTSREIIEEYKAQALARNGGVEEPDLDPDTGQVIDILEKYREEDHDPENWEEKVLDETEEETRQNLQRLIDQYIPDEDDQNTFVAHAAAQVLDKTPPFVISFDKYANDEEEGDEYDKITLTWYPRDRVLLDDADEIVEDVPGTVGWKNLKQFGVDSNDKDTVFIRNRRLRSDFEVVREEDDPLPIHVRYGMDKDEFAASKAAGFIKFRPEDL